MQRIATAAGVSRGMPGYAFGSKAALYEAVLERAFAQPRALAAQLSAGDTDGAEVLATGVAAYVEFLAGHPTYVRLLQRAALDGAGRLGHGAAHQSALADALPLVGEVTGTGGGHDQRQVLVSVLALCFFPFAHRNTLLGPLGVDFDDPAFAGTLTAHILELLRHGLRP
jgi:AcrR family transcriptional regulator